MLTYLAVREGYRYYKKEQDKRIYAADLKRRTDAARADPGAIRRLPPTLDGAAIASAPRQLLIEDTPDVGDVRETTVTVVKPPPPPRPSQTGKTRANLQLSAREAELSATTTIATYTPAPTRPPKLPPKPSGLSSPRVKRPNDRPKPPPKGRLLASFYHVVSPSAKDRSVPGYSNGILEQFPGALCAAARLVVHGKTAHHAGKDTKGTSKCEMIMRDAMTKRYCKNGLRHLV